MRSKRRKSGHGGYGPSKVQTSVIEDATTIQKKTASSRVVCHNDDVMRGDGSHWRVFERRDDVFPAMTPWIVMCVTLAIRVCYVIDPKSWWVLHPDEVFQSMEVAHSQVYGYGFRPYEFTAPYKGDNSSHYQQREMMQGMNALRSPIFPQIYAIVCALITWTGWEGNPFMLWRIWHVTVTSTLPLVVYIYVKATGKPHDVASLSSILVAASSHLNVFGTHTIINSFVSPFLFLSLARVFLVIKIATDSRSSNDHNFLTVQEKSETNFDTKSLYDLKSNSDTFTTNKKDVYPNQLTESSSSNWDNSTKFSKTKSTKPSSLRTGDINILFADMMNVKSDKLSQGSVTLERGHSVSKDSGKGESLRSGSESSLNNIDDEDDRNKNSGRSGESDTKRETNNKNNNHNNHNHNNNSSDLIYDVFVSSSNNHDHAHNINESINEVKAATHTGWKKKNGFESINSNIKITPNASAADESKNDNPSNNVSSLKKSRLSPFIFSLGKINYCKNDVIDFCAGFGTVLCLYVRPDSTLLVAMLILGQIKWREILRLITAKSAWILVFGGLSALALAVTDDILFFDSWVISPWQWTKFNVLSPVSSRLFGVLGCYFYLNNVYFDTIITSALSLLFILSIFVSLMGAIFSLKKWTAGESFSFFPDQNNNRIKDNNNNNIDDDDNGANSNCVFNYFKTDQLHAFVAVAMTTIYSSLGHKEPRFIHDVIVVYFIAVAVAVTSLLSALFSQTNTKRLVISLLLFLFSFNQWNTMPSGKGSDVNRCLHYISTQDDVTGVFLDFQYPKTFSFSILHKDVPLLAPLTHDYLEFKHEFSTTTRQPCLRYSRGHSNKKCRVRFVMLDSVSNLIHLLNTESLVKTLIESTHYNMAVLGRSSLSASILHSAFKPVFQTESVVVWQRTFKPDQEKLLWRLSSGIPAAGKNITLVEYEAEVLKMLGNFYQAAEKFKAILSRPNGVKASVMSSLAFCLHRMGNEIEALKMVADCSEKFHHKHCLSGDKIMIPNLGKL